jgi:hypothetical protein
MGAGAAFGSDADRDRQDFARRGFAALLLSVRDEPHNGPCVSCACCPLPSWARTLLAILLLLPARHTAAFAMDDAKKAPAGTRTNSNPPFHWNRVVNEKMNEKMNEKIVTLPATSPLFVGPYEFASPHALRHAAMPGAWLRAEHQIRGAKFDGRRSAYDIGSRLMRMVIEIDTISPAWTPSMAPWAVALAQSCGGLTPIENGMRRNFRYAPTPFWILFHAVRRSPHIAHALLDVPNGDRFAMDVDNCLGEPAHIIAEPAEPPSGAILLHHLLNQSWPNLALFRRVLLRCSETSLNDVRNERQSPLHSAVQYYYELPRSSASFPDTEAMLLALIARAQPDGGGVDLHLPAPCDWISSKPNLSAYDGLMCADALNGISRITLLIASINYTNVTRAFTNALRRRRTFRADLLLALHETLVTAPPLEPPSDPSSRTLGDCHVNTDSPSVGGLPVRVLLTIVADFLVPPVISQSSRVIPIIPETAAM